MNKKILAFIFNGKRFLALRNNSEDPSHGGDFWFTTTGSLERGESEEEAIKREVKEETGLDVHEVFDLNWGSIYSWGGEDHEEKNFIAFVKKKEVRLSEEHIEYEWLDLVDFVKRVRWDLNKEELKRVLQKAIKKELFFKKKKVDDFRK